MTTQEISSRTKEELIMRRISTMAEVTADGTFTSRDVWGNIPELTGESCYQMTPLVNRLLNKAMALGLVVRTDMIRYGLYNVRYTVWKVVQ